MAKRGPLLVFLLLAFGLGWAGSLPTNYWVLYRSGVDFPAIFYLFAVLGIAAPSLGAVGAAAKEGGRPAIKALMGKLLLWRLPVGWYLLAVGGPLVIGALSLAIYIRWEEKFVNLYVAQLPAKVLFSLLIALGEELGWRGFLLPHFMKRRSPLRAAIQVGILWAIWHAPHYLPGGDRNSAPLALALYAIELISGSVLLTWLSLKTKGSLLFVVLAHASIDIFGMCVPEIQVFRFALVHTAVSSASMLLILSSRVFRPGAEGDRAGMESRGEGA